MPNGKPNILFIMADDIGWFNVSAYNLGIMGYLDRPTSTRSPSRARLFTDFYGQQSCTRRPRGFITGAGSRSAPASPRCGDAGRDPWPAAEDPTIVPVPRTSATPRGQFGKKPYISGDRNEHLPTVHGFDEFFGNLYHLNAEQEPENSDYPKDPKFRKRFGPRGVLKCKATDKDDDDRRRSIRLRWASRRSRTPAP